MKKACIKIEQKMECRILDQAWYSCSSIWIALQVSMTVFFSLAAWRLEDLSWMQRYSNADCKYRKQLWKLIRKGSIHVAVDEIEVQSFWSFLFMCCVPSKAIVVRWFVFSACKWSWSLF